jgi:hypothetical protein
MDTCCSVFCVGLAEQTGRTMLIAGIPREEIRHTRAVQDWLAEGRQDCLQEGR